MGRVIHKVVIDNELVEFDFTPGDRVKRRSLDPDHKATGTVSSIEDGLVIVDWDEPYAVARGPRWMPTSLELVGEGGFGVRVVDVVRTCPYCEEVSTVSAWYHISEKVLERKAVPLDEVNSDDETYVCPNCKEPIEGYKLD
ncbi:hypothetical protein [Alicyclobacillus shizuokensis]|uniref:hypothetical protein n=1 Tax=Alicyclobacillus shizuokensis TaxID=392014 RepID=UPI0008353036|nr:hypothetical protein [Alicyclobacillus shizuokensis]